jgi:hypothetical protein
MGPQLGSGLESNFWISDPPIFPGCSYLVIALG